MIELNWSIFVQMFNFLLLMFILNKILYKPILKVLEEREKKIGDGQQEVKELAAQGNKLVATYNEKLQAAKVEAMASKGNARKQAVEQVNVIIQDARGKAEQEILQVRQRVASEIEAAKKELEPELASMAATIAEQVLGRKVA
ncbi:MAG: ATP synthase F0 subunit B [Syntrophaceae bacterium]